MEFNLENILDKAGSPEGEKGINNIMGVLEEIDKAMSKVDSILGKLEKHGIITVLKKVAIKKYDLANVPDLENPDAIRPASATHKQIFENLNTQPEEKIKEAIEKLKSAANVETSNPK